MIRSDRIVAQLQDPDFAQQIAHSPFKDHLLLIFSSALKVQGGIFDSGARPVVAGLILDSHYSMQQDLIFSHAAHGSHSENGLSLGMFGSHLTHSWPRFLVEVPEGLLDTTCPGETVGNDNGECLMMWEACSVGQGAFFARNRSCILGVRVRQLGWAQNALVKWKSYGCSQHERRHQGFNVE